MQGISQMQSAWAELYKTESRYQFYKIFFFLGINLTLLH